MTNKNFLQIVDFFVHLPTFAALFGCSGKSCKLRFSYVQKLLAGFYETGYGGVHNNNLCIQILIYELFLQILYFFIFIEIQTHIRKNRLSINFSLYFIHVTKHPCLSKARSQACLDEANKHTFHEVFHRGWGGISWHFNRAYYSFFVTWALKSYFFNIYPHLQVYFDIADKYNFHFVFHMPWSIWWHMNCVPAKNLSLLVPSNPGKLFAVVFRRSRQI